MGRGSISCALQQMHCLPLIVLPRAPCATRNIGHRGEEEGGPGDTMLLAGRSGPMRCCLWHVDRTVCGGWHRCMCESARHCGVAWLKHLGGGVSCAVACFMGPFRLCCYPWHILSCVVAAPGTRGVRAGHLGCCGWVGPLNVLATPSSIPAATTVAASSRFDQHTIHIHTPGDA